MKIKSLVKKGDIIVIAFFIVLSTLLLVFNLFLRKEGEYFAVKYDGGTKYIQKDDNCELEIESKGYSLTIVVESGECYVRESDCPDHTCMKTGRISKEGQIIACVPANLIISVEGDSSNELDEVLF